MRAHVVAAAILAGGRARRFGGRDKCRLLVHGRTIINRQLDVLQQVATEVFVVAPDAARFADLGVRVHADLMPDAGALGGIHTALDAAAADGVIVVACDLPFLHAGLLAELVKRSAGHDAAWVHTPRGPEPLLACYRRQARVPIGRAIEAGRLKAADLAGVLDIADVGLDVVERFGSAEQLLTNLNTPEDYEKLR